VRDTDNYKKGFESINSSKVFLNIYIVDVKGVLEGRRVVLDLNYLTEEEDFFLLLAGEPKFCSATTEARCIMA
jgi:hypothetical protein